MNEPTGQSTDQSAVSEPLFTYIPTLQDHKAHILPSESGENISIEYSFVDPGIRIGTPSRIYNGGHLTTGYVSAIDINNKSIQVSFYNPSSPLTK